VRADVDTDPAPSQVGGSVPAVLEQVPGQLHEPALLRVHRLGFERRDVEEGGVELSDAVNEPGVFGEVSGVTEVAQVVRDDPRPGVPDTGHTILAGRELVPESLRGP